jgi:hypothetical protein
MDAHACIRRRPQKAIFTLRSASAGLAERRYRMRRRARAIAREKQEFHAIQIFATSTIIGRKHEYLVVVVIACDGELLDCLGSTIGIKVY